MIKEIGHVCFVTSTSFLHYCWPAIQKKKKGNYWANIRFLSFRVLKTHILLVCKAEPQEFWMTEWKQNTEGKILLTCFCFVWLFTWISVQSDFDRYLFLSRKESLSCRLYIVCTYWNILISIFLLHITLLQAVMKSHCFPPMIALLCIRLHFLFLTVLNCIVFLDDL